MCTHTQIYIYICQVVVKCWPLPCWLSPPHAWAARASPIPTSVGRRCRRSSGGDPPNVFSCAWFSWFLLIFHVDLGWFGIIWDYLGSFGIQNLGVPKILPAHENQYENRMSPCGQVAHQACTSPAQRPSQKAGTTYPESLCYLVVSSHITICSCALYEPQSYCEKTTAMEVDYLYICIYIYMCVCVCKTSKIQINRFIVNSPGLQVG